MKKMTKRKLNLRNFTKVIAIAICLAGVTKVVAQSKNAQFPTPQNFQMRLNYIMLDDWGFCAGESVVGPYHCTDFQWHEPDLSETESQLVGYKIYHYYTEEELAEIPFSEGEVIIQTATTAYSTKGGFVGYTWATAVYSEPDGESEPSNIEANLEGIPLVVNENEIKTYSIVYCSQTKTIEIKGLEDISSINIFGIDGRFIAASKSNNIDAKYLTSGIYIIRATTKKGKTISDKLIIE